MSTINKKVSLAVVICLVWFLLIGFRFIGYISEIGTGDFRTIVCGTNGCSDLMFFLSTVWTFVIYLIIPLVIPIVLVFYIKKGRRSKKIDCC
ncbi:hypothetical protein E2R51_14835 [Jeotgalibacillus sp. S-D1]|uniref:hypothetical protein n=1 Tax=Jeotgalibacillus sp. S-D1 TaxID=2552189 RepID=UPI00105A0899|nr:hypothetical protein [Jeotgalibacillus sp. S-D1]TDL31070.1 hypothetical protein E2R51_14835 [Jeotgalibacillus sp. S-D1]